MLVHLLLLSPELLSDNSPVKNVCSRPTKAGVEGRAGDFSADLPFLLPSIVDFSVLKPCCGVESVQLLCLTLGEGVGRDRLGFWGGEPWGQSRIEGGEAFVRGCGQWWGERFPYGNRVCFCSQLSSQEDGPAQQRVPQFALKVSLGTFQFNLSPPFFFFYHVELGSLGKFSHFGRFFWPFSCCFLAIVLQKK